MSKDSNLVINLLFLFLLLLLYISQKFIIARFAAFERNKVHQILKMVSISSKHLAYAFRGFFFNLFLVFSLILSFFGYSFISNRSVPLVSTVPRFCVPIDHGGPDFLQGRNKTFTLVSESPDIVLKLVNQDCFVPSSYL